MTSPSFVDLVDLVSERMGGAAVAANDEFFAPKEGLIRPGPPVWREGEYTERGKWMDGWETRRLRGPRSDDHDWCILRLGVPGLVRGVDVDTAYFTGNFPEACAIDACDLAGLPAVDQLAGAPWRVLLPRTVLMGDSHNLIAIDSALRATHLRLRIFPDGGVARLRAYGDAVVDWERLRRRGDVDLAAAAHGGVVAACSDMFYGSRHNLIMPGDATHMGDGWETKRRRGPGHDWTVIRLGAPGSVRRIDVDTRHFKGNAPATCSLEGSTDNATWRELLPATALQPDARHEFEDEVRAIGDVSHVRFNIFPDGGVGRLRLYGRPR